MVNLIYKMIISVFIISLLGAGTAHARFLQTDPIGYEGGQNLYAYVENDPINLNDPDGEKPQSAHDQIYIYPKLTPNQRRLVAEQHFKNGEIVFNTFVAPLATALPIGGIAIRGGSILVRGGLRILANSRFGRSTAKVADIASKRGLNQASAARKGQGVRFSGNKGEDIRIMRGNSKSQNASQRGNYVKVTQGGKVRDAKGNVIERTDEFKNPSQNPRAHIPLKEFLENNR